MSLSDDDIREIGRATNGVTIWYVRAGGNDTTGNGKSPATAYATVSKAHTEASDGDTIDVGIGTFTTNLALTKALTIRGAGIKRSVLQSAAANPPVDSVLKADAAGDLVLRDLTLDNNNTGGNGGSGALCLYYFPFPTAAVPSPASLVCERVEFVMRGAQGSLMYDPAVYLQTMYAAGGPPDDGARVLFDSCVFDADGPALFAEDNHEVVVDRCLIRASGGFLFGGGTTRAVVRSSILSLSRRGSWGSEVIGIMNPGGEAAVLVKGCEISLVGSTGTFYGIYAPATGGKTLIVDTIINVSPIAGAYAIYAGGSGADVQLGRNVLYDPARVNITNSATVRMADGLTSATALTSLAGISSLANWLRALTRKSTADATALSEMNSGSGTFDATTDSLEAIRDNM